MVRYSAREVFDIERGVGGARSVFGYGRFYPVLRFDQVFIFPFFGHPVRIGQKSDSMKSFVGNDRPRATARLNCVAS